MGRISWRCNGFSPEENWQEGEIATIDFLRQTGKIISLDFKKKEALVEVEGRKVKTSFLTLRKWKRRNEENDFSSSTAINYSPCPGLKPGRHKTLSRRRPGRS